LLNDFFSSDCIAAIALMLTVLLSFYAIKKFLQSRLHIQNSNNNTHPFIVKTLFKTKLFFLAALTLYFCSPLLPKKLMPFISTLTFIATTFQIGIWGNFLLIYFIGKIKFRDDCEHGIPHTAKNLLQILGQCFIWIVILLFLLDNLNFDVATLIAGLGISGIAVALALQNILGDILASLSIIVDKPFMVGDFIIIDDFKGTVQYIGIKTTRLRSLSGEQIILSNSDLLKGRVRNYKRMEERRVLVEINIPYETPIEKLELIPKLLQQIIEATDQVRFDRAHFKKIDTYALNFEIVYYVLSREYSIHMDVQQEINLQLFHAFSEHEINFAYPTQRKL